MARGVRRSQREKLEEKLISVEEAITRYEECLEKLKNEKNIEMSTVGCGIWQEN